VIRVVVTDRDQSVREHLTAVIEAQPDIEVLATASTPAQTRAAVAEHRPHVVIVDPHVGDDHGLDTCLQVQAANPEAKCILYTTGITNPWADSDAIAAIVPKQLNTNQLLTTIRHLAARSPDDIG